MVITCLSPVSTAYALETEMTLAKAEAKLSENLKVIIFDSDKNKKFKVLVELKNDLDITEIDELV